LEPRRELDSLAKYKEKHHSCLLCDLVDVEVNLKDRMVVENDSWICIVPFWAIWPFETIVLPRRHISAMDSLDKSQQNDLASILRIITCKYDNLFETSFPYSMGIHGSPNNDDIKNHLMHLHLHFYPPLLRSATVKKFLVG
jgi:UDPglucose--hexose-1-phosphate uridylyltransferase